MDYAHPAVRDDGGIVALSIFASHKPVIGAINGPAVGIGATMTLPMDFRLASEAARSMTHQSRPATGSRR